MLKNCRHSPILNESARLRYDRDEGPACAGREAIVQKKMFWMIFLVLSLVADFTLPFLWSAIATLPILLFSWWIVYRSDWLS